MAQGRGRPLKFGTPEELLERAEEYFSITPPRIQTITGLALALDTSRETLVNYEARDEFFDAVKKCKVRIEYAYELSLRERGSAGDIFGLKNMGWSDRQETDITTKGEAFNSGTLDAAAIDARLAALIASTKAGTDKPARSQEPPTS